MARKKVKLAWITNDAIRRSTLKKRGKGVIKKISELTVLCGVEGCAVIYNPEDQEPEVFPNVADARRILTSFQSLPEGERTRKMMSQQTFMQDRITKMKEQIDKAEKQNKDMELCALIYEGLAGGDYAEVGVENVSAVAWALEENIIKVTERIRQLMSGAPAPQTADPGPSTV
ncbi:hypothetical protein LUZ60_015763 [Juncus effusus]|nr:hypothetical protein LUZ60_015763 [Juncus effusus]